jgi:hypothetical protein
MAKPTIQLPDFPEDWYKSVTGVSPSGGTLGQTPRILDGLTAPREWSPADSGLNVVMSPEEIKTIDFTGAAPPEPPPWLGGTSHGPAGQPDPGISQSGGEGFYSGLTPYQPVPDALQPSDYSKTLSGPPGKDWTQLPRPGDVESGEHGSGYYVYGTDDTGRAGTTADGQWGRSKAMEVTGAVADQLATADAYTPFGVGNISLPSGGRFPPHNWHQDGLGIDVRPARVDGAQLPVTYQDRHYDREATQRLVDAFRVTGQVDKIYFNDPKIHGVQHSKGHDNHFHVQLKR